MKKPYGRYTLKVDTYQGGRMIHVFDNYWDKRYVVFVDHNGQLDGGDDKATDIFQENPELLPKAKVGHCYQIKTTEPPFGKVVGFVEVPESWYRNW